MSPVLIRRNYMGKCMHTLRNLGRQAHQIPQPVVQTNRRSLPRSYATWTQVALALGVTTAEARDDFVRWTDAQSALWDSGAGPSGVRYGLSPKHRQTVRALASRRD